MHRRIRLVHVTTVPQTLGFFRGQIGYLKTHGFEVQAISSPGVQAEEFQRTEDIKMHYVSMTRAISPACDLIALKKLWELFRIIKPDIVHAHTPKAGLLGVVSARAAHVPCVFLSLFGLAQMTKKGIMRKVLDASTRIDCMLAHRVWCDSLSMRDYVIRERLCSAKKVMVLGLGSVNGVDAERTFSKSFYPREQCVLVRRMNGVPAEAIVLGFVGRIVRDKGMHELTEAWKILRHRNSNIHLLFVGESESKDSLLASDEAVLNSDPRVHFVGWCSDTPKYFAIMDIFVMPSHREGFGVTNIEAAAMELPVVSTRIPGCVDSVQDGLTGILVRAYDSNALAEAIQTYIDHPDLRIRHGKAGRIRVLQDFRPEKIWEALRFEYEQQIKHTH